MKNVCRQIDELFYEPVDLWEMSGLKNDLTGLPFNIWVSPRTANKHIPRIKVWVNRTTLVPVSIADPIVYLAPEAPQLSSRKFELLCQFIRVNRATLLAFWREEINVKQMANSLAAI